ncbi:MAG: TonB-dependent receptor, partial [Paludibacter sp.]
MRKLSLMLFVSFFTSLSLLAQTSARGVVKDNGTGNPLPGVKITLLQQNISTQTNAEGEFTLSLLVAGDEEISISRDGYFTQIKLINLKKDNVNDLGVYSLKADVQEEVKEDMILQLSESQMSDDEGKATQTVSASLSSKGDVYASQASFSFSPVRFRTRGYDQDFESTYINGVHFNGLERGGFNYSMLGGLNDAMRNKDIVNGLEANSFSYGNLGSNTNINANATAFATGSKASLAYTNRAYKLRGQYTYATGLMPNGWAFAGSAVVRWADEGIVEGTFYNSAGYFFSAEKVFNKKHSLSLITFGAPTQRAQQGGVTQEVYDLAGSIYYNPYWGYQDGKKRNSRVVKSFDPTVILSHDFKIDEKQRLRTGIAYHYSLYSNSAIGFYNAPDPRPDYYRYLPSFQTNAYLKDQIAQMWENNDNVSQVNWASLYQANYRNNVVDPTGSAKYVVERRHNDLMETTLNSTYVNQIKKELKLTAGVEAKYAKGMHYKTMEDLLGGKQWIDIDQFSERDFPNSNIIQNDLRNPNAVIKTGDIFGYNYDMNILHGAAFIQNEWVLPQLDIFYAGKVTYTQFSRFGHMENGRATAIDEISFGQGKTWFFIDPSFKAGATYKIDGRNRLILNAIAETRAPLANNSYVSERIKDTRIPNLQSEKILSYDLTYAFTFPTVRGRISGFRTHILGSSEMLGYYDDEYRTFINHILTKSDKIHQGIEAGLSVKLNNSFSISMAGTYADYHYTNNAYGIKSPENGAFADLKDTVMTNGLKVSNGPQLAANITLDYFNSKMWFADITLNYFDNNYLDFAPNRFT